uniref:acyltransferase family protein n=1 Tax=Halomonas sp. TaxID=1486246 RepID=UPI00260276E0|nr:acyltransferase [Halomonas sp.]
MTKDDAIHYHALDGLRGIAALVVVIAHMSIRTDLQDFLRISGLGQIGVMLFFALSGFLMMHVTQGKQCRTYVHDFMVKRLSRVYPLYFFVVLLAFLTSFIPAKDHFLSIYRIEDISSVFHHLILIDGNVVLWTISIEIIFYIIFPVFWLAKDKGWIYFYILVVSVFIAQQTVYGALRWGDLETAFLRIIPRGHMFLIGMAVYPIFLAMKERMVVFDVLLIISLFALGINLQEVSKSIFGHGIYVWKNTAAVISCGAILICVVFSKHLRLFFEYKISIFLGKISYSIYLTHMFVLNALVVYTGWETSDKIAYWAAGFLLTILISCLTYKFIESPFRSMLNQRFCTGVSTGIADAKARKAL